ncbi:PAS domain-containing protein [Pelagibius marinus]|uniref:PAS domain-containing protein n=1 Tax=Pelagibius marinus TaxID=2762760 RepID=UPI0018728F1F|nr:PAS domain-containing protein [Pelagibius marinus]
MVSIELVESEAQPPESAVALLAAWQRFNADGKGPTREDFTPFVLKPWLGNIDVYVVEDGGPDRAMNFRMRLNGTEVVALTGEDWTSKTARDIDRSLGVNLHEELLSVYRSKRPLAHHIRIFQKDYVTAYRLLLPIFSEERDGTVVQIFLAIFDEG